jgi:hypothetical protein
MADITSPQAIKFVTEQARPLADALVAFYYAARRVRDRYAAIGGASLIPNTVDVVVDGAASNGSPLATGADVNAALGLMASVLTDLEANNQAKLMTLLRIAPGDNNQVR